MPINKILLMNQSYLSTHGNGVVFSANNQLAVKGADSIFDICADKNGNIYGTDPDNHLIVKITSQNQVIPFAGASGESGINFGGASFWRECKI